MSVELERRVETGVPELDRAMGGGIPQGHVVALTAPPDIQSELLLERMLTAGRTLYVSTIRPEAEVESALERSHGPVPDRVTIEHVPPSELLESPAAVVNRVDRGGCILVDPVNGLELGGREEYLEFLNDLKRAVELSDAVALLHCVDEEQADLERELTLYRSDITWRLRQRVDPNDVETYLTITKFRGGGAVAEPIKMVLTDDIRIDRSRDIA